MELCSYSVWPPNEGRVSFGGFLLAGFYIILNPCSSLPLHCATLYARGLPIPESASGLGLDGQANLCDGAICLPARSCPLKVPLAERVDHVGLARRLRSLGNGQAIRQVAAPQGSLDRLGPPPGRNVSKELDKVVIRPWAKPQCQDNPYSRHCFAARAAFCSGHGFSLRCLFFSLPEK